MKKLTLRLMLLLAGLAAFIGMLPLGAETVSSKAQKGKIVILVLDVSGSIRPHFSKIQKVLSESILKKRLSVGDYCELITFGDAVQTMYAGQILRPDDPSAIVNSLMAMKADNDYTDIGSALKAGVEQVVQLKGEQFDLYEPLVLFLTDGNHTPGADSAFYGKKVDDFFQDPLIGDKSLYSGWYIVGVGKNLTDLKRVAELSGREEYFITIEDLSLLESILDEWIQNIPPPKSLEFGSVDFIKTSLGGKRLDSKRSVVIDSSASQLLFDISSTYVRTPVRLEFVEGSALFQTEDKSNTVSIPLSMEAGTIELKPMSRRQSSASFAPESALTGKGTLKINIANTQNHIEEMTDLVFPVEFVPVGALFWRLWGTPIILVALLFILFIIFSIAKGFLPVKITMEIIGKTVKFPAVALAIGKRVEFGNKPGLKFKLDAAGSFPPVIGAIERSGKSSFSVKIRDSASFAENQNLSANCLNVPVKLVTRDGVSVTVKFKLGGGASRKSGKGRR